MEAAAVAILNTLYASNNPPLLHQQGL